MANFNLLIDKLLRNEGGYVNDPDDAGGETKFGISRKSYPDVDIQSFTLEKAKDIYRKDYWERIHGDFIISNDVAGQVFDMAVNSGVKKATYMVQEVCDIYRDSILANRR